MRAVPLVVAACLAACQPTRPRECPGTRVASFHFHATVNLASSTCPFRGGVRPAGSAQVSSQPTSLDFGGTLAWDPAGTEAALCLDRPLSVPHLGSHAGDHVVVQVAFDDVEISPCSCPTHVVESVEGDVTRDAQGAPAGFRGTLRNDVTPTQSTLADGGAPGDCYCGPPCEIRYDLDGGT